MWRLIGSSRTPRHMAVQHICKLPKVECKEGDRFNWLLILILTFSCSVLSQKLPMKCCHFYSAASQIELNFSTEPRDIYRIELKPLLHSWWFHMKKVYLSYGCILDRHEHFPVFVGILVSSYPKAFFFFHYQLELWVFYNIRKMAPWANWWPKFNSSLIWLCQHS
jgi:hypothetical protein